MLSNIVLVFRILYISILIHPTISDSYRLSGCIIPKHYNLKILASVEDELAYTGTLEILTQCINATDKISLHRDSNIEFDKIEIKEIEPTRKHEKGNEVGLAKILYSNKMQYVMITTLEELKENQHYVIYIEFRGNLTETPSGIFRGNLSTLSGVSYYAITIFEPMGARKAFPCFDEPGMTATFELTIGRKEKYNSTSNMQLVKSEPVEGKDGWYWDYFMNSFPMSTYLVCFMIYDTEFTWTGKQGDQINILARKKIGSTMNMVTKTSPKLLTYLQEYFQMPFPFPKLDVITVPHIMGYVDSISTPGLIIMHEELLFYEAFSMKQDEVQDILLDVTEKITFQWFSVLSVDWWSDVWFITSLANYNAHNALKEMSQSNFIDSDEADSIQLFFQQSGGLPFPEVIFGDFASVKAAMSSIDYKKCDLLLRMAHFLDGATDITYISTKFLKKNYFQKVGPGDLWTMFDSAKETPLSVVMASWVHQGGYPVVEVTRNYELNTAILIQTEYPSKNVKQNNCWWIPIIYSINNENNNLNVRDWLRCPNETLEIQSLPSSEWLLLNLHVNSLYRVNYDNQNWNLLHLTLKDPLFYNTIPSLNRMQLVDDLFEFTANGNLTYNFSLEFMEFLRFDHSYPPWSAFSKNMFILHWRLKSSQGSFGLLSLYMQNILRPHFNTRKLDDGEHSSFNGSFSAIITDVSCFFQLPSCLKEVKRAFIKFREKKQLFHIEPPFAIDQRDIIFCYAIKYGNIDDFDFLLNAFTTSTNIFEREDMLRGLYCTKDPSLLKKLPTSRRVIRNVEHMEKRNFHLRNIKNEISSNYGNPSIYTGAGLRGGPSSIGITNGDGETVSDSKDGNTETPLETGTPSETETPSESKTPSETETPLKTATATMTTGEVMTTSDVPNASTSSSNSSGFSLNDESRVDSDGPSLEYIIARCEFEIVSDLFYRNIRSIGHLRALHYIWIFSERVNTKKDFDYFQRFFEENKDEFRDIEDHIEGSIFRIKMNLRWQEQKSIKVIEALKKNLDIHDKRSDASKRCINYVLKLSSILGILSIFILLKGQIFH